MSANDPKRTFRYLLFLYNFLGLKFLTKKSSAKRDQNLKETKVNTFDGVFKVDGEGNSVFFPNGIMGKGYIIQSEEKRKRIRKLQKIFIYGSMISMGICMPVGGILLWFIIALPFTLIVYFRTKKILKGLPVSDLKLTHADWNAAFIKSFPAALLWVAEFTTLLFIAGGIKIIITEDRNVVGLIVGIIILGYFAYSIGKMIIQKRKSQ